MTDRFQLKVAAKTALTDRITEFVLSTDAALPPYQAGAHVLVTVGDGETRAYSLIDLEVPAADQTEYRIAVLLEQESTGGSTFMHALDIGANVTVSAPKNDFLLNPDAPAILLAGGIGVTPMISMATALAANGQEFQFHYAARTTDQMAYRDQLIAGFGNALHLHFDDDPSSALDLSAVMSAIKPGKHLYICGPRGMIDAARNAADAAGIGSDRVHVELFEAAASTDTDQSFEVELASNGQVYTVPPGKSIIDVLEDAGVDVMYDCQRGDCGICQCDVISGTPDHRDVVLSEDERNAGKVMQICVSRAKSARLVLDI